MQSLAWKVMRFVFWDAKGVILRFSAERGHSYRCLYKKNAGSNCTRMFSCIRITHPVAIATAAIAQVGLGLVEHLPYAPDLIPSEYQLFPKFKDHLCGKRFALAMLEGPWENVLILM
ncbi:hypothetical protein Trydic_g13595 [Trypoxylus dichotomus]